MPADAFALRASISPSLPGEARGAKAWRKEREGLEMGEASESMREALGGAANGAATAVTAPGAQTDATGKDAADAQADAMGGKAVGSRAGSKGAKAAPSAATCADLRAVLEARASFYETLASLYFKPLTQKQIDAMAAADFSAYADVNDVFAEGLNDMARYLRRRNSGTRQELAVDFTGAFAGTSAYEGKTAVPYKSVFTSDKGLMYQEGYQEVFTAFKHEAVKRRAGLDWPDDHLSFMCQFMAILSRRASRALEQGDVSGAVHDLEASREFLERHMASWFTDFASLASRLLSTRFYRGVLKVTEGFFKLDGETVADLLDEVRG